MHALSQTSKTVCQSASSRLSRLNLCSQFRVDKQETRKRSREHQKGYVVQGEKTAASFQRVAVRFAGHQWKRKVTYLENDVQGSEKGQGRMNRKKDKREEKIRERRRQRQEEGLQKERRRKNTYFLFSPLVEFCVSPWHQPCHQALDASGRDCLSNYFVEALSPENQTKI